MPTIKLTVGYNNSTDPQDSDDRTVTVDVTRKMVMDFYEVQGFNQKNCDPSEFMGLIDEVESKVYSESAVERMLVHAFFDWLANEIGSGKVAA